MPRSVILVAGPPCSGKTTYVAARAKPGDVILDQDVIGATAMRQGLTQVAGMTSGTAWVIRCCPGPQRRATFARQIGATDTVLLTAPAEELIARAAHRPTPRRHIQAVRDWLRREALDAPVRSAGAHKPRPAKTTTERGYGWEHQQARARAIRELRRAGADLCPYCCCDMTADMPLDYDHYPPLALGGGGERRLTHSSCNRRAGQELGQQRRRGQQPQMVNSQPW